MTRLSKRTPPVAARPPFPSAHSAKRPVRLERSVSPYERNIHTSLAGRLGRDIVNGTYPPGSLLPTALEMCARFSVSRTALREAYSVLTAKALIVARPKIGTRVRPKADWNMLDPEVLSWHLQTTPTEDFVAELFVLRQMVEPPAAALAATARSHATTSRIADAYGRMERFREGAGDLIDADLDFHMGILQATGNHFLTALGGLIRTCLECTFELSWEGASKMQEARLHQHRAIFEAIRDGATELARKRMTELLQDSMNDVREFLKQRDEARESAPTK